MAFLFNFFKKKEEKVNQNTITLYLNDKKTVTIEPEQTLTCQQLCERYAHEFANRNKRPDLRVMLIMEDPRVIVGSSKPNSGNNPNNAQAEKLIITKRVLGPLDRVFPEEFFARLQRQGSSADQSATFMPKMVYKYQLVDMNDFARISAPIVSYSRRKSVSHRTVDLPDRQGRSQ